MSVRGRLLKRLQNSSNELTSGISGYLLTNKSSLVSGAIYEFLALYLLPLLTLGMILINILYIPGSVHLFFMDDVTTWPQNPLDSTKFFKIYLIFQDKLSQLIFIAGIFVAVLPPLALLCKETNLAGKLGSYTAGGVLNKLFGIQWVSFLLPYLCGQALTKAIICFGILVPEGSARQLLFKISNNDLVVYELAGVPSVTISMYFILAFIAIFFSLQFRRFWPAVVSTLVFYALLSTLEGFPHFLQEAVKPGYFDPNGRDWTPFYQLFFPILFLAITLAYFLALRATRIFIQHFARSLSRS